MPTNAGISIFFFNSLLFMLTILWVWTEWIKVNIFKKKEDREALGSVIYAEEFKVRAENCPPKYLTVSHLCNVCSQGQKPLIVLRVFQKDKNCLLNCLLETQDRLKTYYVSWSEKTYSTLKKKSHKSEIENSELVWYHTIWVSCQGTMGF